MPAWAGAVCVALAIGLSACTSDEFGSESRGISQPGPWSIPTDTLAIGDTQYVEYTGAGPWQGTSSCSGGMEEGTVLFREFLKIGFPQISQMGGYSCRSIVGNSSQTSVHATGRALDIHIPLHNGEADNDYGDPIGNWLIENAEYIGIQYIIWDRWSWGAHRAAGDKSRSYGGAHPHHDHLHIELSVEAAALGSDFFTVGEIDPPSVASCGTIPAEGGVVDDTDTCAFTYGPSQYWRVEEGAGYGGRLMWTNAYEGDDPSNWGRWVLDFDAAGSYDVEVYIEPGYGVHRSARYEIAHGGELVSVEVDLSQADGWTELGTFDFAAGGSQEVAVMDNAFEPVGDEQHIPFDAIRLTPSAAGGEEREEEPEVPDEERSAGLLGGCATSGSGAGAPVWLLAGLWLATRRRRASRSR